MHTPGHATINLAVIGTVLSPELAWPVLIGGIMPDVPILYLYARERWLRGTPDHLIWSDHYQRPFWQNLVHGMHSIPLAATGLVIGLVLRDVVLIALFGSHLLHVLADLPIHAEDAHRHFLPLSNYRFISPLSYWDPRHHGRWVALVEALLVFAACATIWAWEPGSVARVCLAIVALFYSVAYWRAFLRPELRTPIGRAG